MLKPTISLLPRQASGRASSRTAGLARAGALLALLAASALAGCTSVSLDPKDLGLREQALYGYPVRGIDVAKYQGSIDWNAVRRSGVAFAYLKATEGGDRVDDNFERNWAATARAGIPHGAYHFFYLCRSGAEQAAWFIRNVPKEAGALPPVLDVEWTPDSPTCTRRPPRAELIREMTAFLEPVERYYGTKAIIYVPIDVHRDRLVDAFPDHEFWLRSVKDHPQNVYQDRDFRFWQWTGTGTVPGVDGGVDRNVFAGTREDWDKWLTHRQIR